MLIPDRVKIGGLDYRVHGVKNLYSERDRYGESCAHSQTITLDSDLTEQIRETTFVHELLHQLDETYHIKLEHDQVYQLEAALYAFVRDNPGVFT